MIRTAGPDDWAAIWPFFHQIVAAGETFTYATDLDEPAARAMWMLGAPARTVVAVDDTGAVRGTSNMYANRAGPGSHVASASFMVDPAYAGRGVGRALCEDALEWGAGAGFRAMVFNAVAATNTRAIALYESLGFRVVGTVPDGFRHPSRGFVGLHMMHRRL
jgi:ribosomal protein S18 acetylase RimI-like enzyme